MACTHPSCTCQIKGCGLTHPPGWKPTMVISINGVEVGGDDEADCVAHYLIHLGYPTDRPDHVRNMGERMVARHKAKVGG